MSYEDLTDDLVSVIQGMARFATADVSKGDDRKLAHGKNDCVILYPGPFVVEEEGEISQGREDINWTVYVDIFQRVGAQNPATGWDSFCTMRDDMISTLRKYPNLSQTTIFIKEVGVSATDPPQYVFNERGQGPFFIVQRVIAEIVENTTVTGGDYA